MYNSDNNNWINGGGNENEWTDGCRLGRGQEGAFNGFLCIWICLLKYDGVTMKI